MIANEVAEAMQELTITLTRYGRSGETEEDLSEARTEEILEAISVLPEGVTNALLVIEGPKLRHCT